jgi:hypothetical protein
VLFRDLVDNQSIVSLLDFENREGLFPAVHREQRFCLLTLSGHARPAHEAKFLFFAHSPSDLADPERQFTLSNADFALLNPNTRTCPIFRSRRDAELTKAIYRRTPVLVNENAGDDGNPWGVSFRQGLFNMTTDSGLFRTRERLEEEGWTLEGNVFRRDEQTYVPLLEGKLTEAFNHRFSTFADASPADIDKGNARDISPAALESPDVVAIPRYWVPGREVERELDGAQGLLSFHAVANPNNEDTAIFTVIPPHGVGHSLFLIHGPDARRSLLLCAFGNSAVCDYLVRVKGGSRNLSFFIVKQLATPPPSAVAAWAGLIVPAALELTYTAWDLKAFAAELGWHGAPFRWDSERRFLIRCELDAVFLHLYGIERDDADFILDTFAIVRRNDVSRFGEYRTKRVTLEVYDAMAAAFESGIAYRTAIDPPPGDAAAAHSPRPGDPGNVWVPWKDEERPAEGGGAEQPAVRRRPSPTRQPKTSTASRPARPAIYAEAGPAVRRAAETTAPVSANQGTLGDLARAATASGDWLPEEAVDADSVVPGRHVRHRSFGEGVVIEVRHTAKPPTVTIRFGVSDDREIAIGYGLLEFEA